MSAESIGKQIADQFPSLDKDESAKLAHLVNVIEGNRLSADKAAGISLERAIRAEAIAEERLAAVLASARFAAMLLREIERGGA